MWLRVKRRVGDKPLEQVIVERVGKRQFFFFTVLNFFNFFLLILIFFSPLGAGDCGEGSGEAMPQGGGAGRG